MRGILSADQTVDKLANTSRQPRIIYNNDPPLQDFQINSIHKNTREQEDTDNT